MFYIAIRVLDPGNGDGYMEVYQGQLQRVTNLTGQTINPVTYTVTNDNPPQPSWALPDPPEPPPPPLPVPEVVAKSQFIAQLVRSQFLTEAQAIQAATIGEFPTPIAALMANLPEDVQLEARIAWATVGEIRRDSNIINMMMEANNITGEAMDEFFRQAAAIVF